MRILYIASRTAEQETLALEREITDVQRQVSQASVAPVEMTFLPDLTLEELPLALSRYRPDVLHVSVHGDHSGLSFAKEAFEGEQREFVPVTGKALAAYVDPEHPPKLVFLNACNSRETAQELADAGITAIGTSAPITNRAAVAASRLMYERLLGGRSVAVAFEAMNQLVQSMERVGVSLQLCHPPSQNPGTLVLNFLPRIAARLATHAVVKSDRPVELQIGVVGCPRDTVQVVFFTADPSFDEDEDNRETHMSEIVRDTPRRGEYWTEWVWSPVGDFHVAACGITSGGTTFSVGGMLTDALKQYAANASPSEQYLSLLEKAVALLRRNDGAGLEGWVPDCPAKKRKKPSKRRTTTEEEEEEEEE